MLISLTSTDIYGDSSLFKTLLPWGLQFLVIFLLFSLLILFYYWRQHIKNLFVNKGLKQRLGNDRQQSFETKTIDTIRKIPLQTSASKRRMLTSKLLKTNNKKSSTLSPSRSKKSRRTVKTTQPIASSSTIKISLIISKENIDQTFSNISSLTIHGIEGLKPKHISRSISIELPGTNIAHDSLNKTDSTSPNDTNSQQIANDFKRSIDIIVITLSNAHFIDRNSIKSLQIQTKHNEFNNDQES